MRQWCVLELIRVSGGRGLTIATHPTRFRFFVYFRVCCLFFSEVL